MNRLNNHKGVSLVELLAYIVIFSIVTALLATILTLVTTATSRIITNGKANTEGMLITRNLETSMQNFSSTDFANCPGNTECIILENHFAYVYSSTLGEVVLEVYNPVREFEIEINNGELFYDGVAILIDGFTLHSSSNITLTQTGNQVAILIEIVLESASGLTYTFYANYSFVIQSVPV